MPNLIFLFVLHNNFNYNNNNNNKAFIMECKIELRNVKYNNNYYQHPASNG